MRAAKTVCDAFRTGVSLADNANLLANLGTEPHDPDKVDSTTGVYTPTQECDLRIRIMIDQNSKVEVEIDGNAGMGTLNSGDALTANALYEFRVGVSANETIKIVLDTPAGNVTKFSLQMSEHYDH